MLPDLLSGRKVMAKEKAEEPISTEERKTIFLALVQSQDEGMSLVRSRKAIAERFEISDRQLREIEKEGIDGNWPPLE
jgi:hypothetical protein